LLCGGVAIETGGRRLPDALFAGRQGRLTFAYLVCERHRSVPREELADLLWGDQLPASWASSLSAVISKLRRLLTEAGLDGPAALPSAFGSYRLHLADDAWIDWEAAGAAVDIAEQSIRDGETDVAIAHAKDAEEIARRGFLTDDCLWVDAQRARLREIHMRAEHVRAEAHLRAGDHRRAVEAARDALALDDTREESYRLLMHALAGAGERGEALRVWERCRTLLVEELGIDPAPETEAVYLSILGPTGAREASALPSGIVTFLLTDIVDSTSLWEHHPSAMDIALERHDHLVEEVVEASGGVLLKAKLEGDATVSVFPRASAGALAALALRDAIAVEPWPDGAAPGVRMALHTGEAIERDGDYFGPALNRAARLRSLAHGNQILVSQAVAEVVRDHLPGGTVLRSLGEHQLRGLTRGEHVFELAPIETDDDTDAMPALPALPLPTVLAGRGAFVGRSKELAQLATDWATVAARTARAVLIGGEPGVGKTRLAAEWAHRAHEQGALVLYGRCDEELGAPYQPFAEALRALLPHVGADRLRSVRGAEEIGRLVPELADLFPALPPPAQADPDTERYVLFDALARLVAVVSEDLPVLVVIDDLHWAAKPTLLLLRHLLRSGEGSRLQVVATYRTTDLDRNHPLAGVLADLHRDGTAERVSLDGLEAVEVNEYLSAVGYEDARLGAALATVTSGNPFFLIEVLRHVEESGGAWDPSTLPQGVREAVSRRLSRLSDHANDALLACAVAGSEFSLELIERVVERDLVDELDEARRAGLVVEERGSRFRFNHALVRQTLLTEVASVKRIRLHQRVAAALEAERPAGDDTYVADLARHYFECAFAGGAAKAVDYSRRAGEQAMARLAYEEAAELFDRALQAADIEGSECDDHDQAELLLARCEALLAAGEPTAAVAVVEQLEHAAKDSPRLAAWATCYAGQLAVLTHPERLAATADEVGEAAALLAKLGDAEGEAKAHTVRASCLARLGRVADCEAALDRALTAGRRADDPRRVNAVLAGAPLAALWGPSPLARASGRCLDVVRVLRITTASAAVETIALRSQAVLEALRGRTDAARRMLDSARRSLEAIGHTHGLFETDVFAGMVELLAGDASEAEQLLRRAYDGFVARGVGVDAAQAGALLARAVLAQGRVQEAIALTEDSERLAGVDLKSAIAWRSARAEALAREGRIDEALDAARMAVALAEPTDALIDQADAHLSLAIVLAAAGDRGGSQDEARRAVELYERKGATARVDAVRPLLAAEQGEVADIAVRPTIRRRFRPNLATAALAAEGGDVEILASLGERHAFARRAGQLEVVRTDDHGKIEQVEHFAIDEFGHAQGSFITLHADELEPSRRAGRLRMAAYLGEGESFIWSDDAVVVDHRPASLGTLEGREAIRAAGRALRDLAPLHRHITDVLGCDENHFLVAVVAEGTDDHGGSVQIETLAIGWFDDDGHHCRAEWYAPDQINEALARFDEVVGEPSSYLMNAAVLASNKYRDLTMAHTNDDALRECISEHAWIEDLRPMFRFRTEGRDGVFEVAKSIIRAGATECRLPVLAIRGDRLALLHQEFSGAQGEVHTVAIARSDEAGLYLGATVFDETDLDAAFTMLDDEYADGDGDGAAHPVAWTFSRAFVDAYNARDWDAISEGHAEAYAIVDHRPAGWGTVGREQAVATLKAMVDLVPDVRMRIVAVLGLARHAALLLVDLTGLDDSGGDIELRFLSVGLGDADDRLLRIELFAEADLAAARARFEELTAPLPDELMPEVATAERPSNDATRRWAEMLKLYEASDWDEFARRFSSLGHSQDRRSLVGGHSAFGPDEMLEEWRSVAAVGATTVTSEPVATRGERLFVERSFLSGTAGEVELVSLHEFDLNGQYLGGIAFDTSDIDEALAELDARHAANEAMVLRTAASVLQPNAPVVAFTLGGSAHFRGDDDYYLSVLSPDIRFEDHRHGVGGYALEGLDAVMQIKRGIGLVRTIECTVLATLGERLALARMDFLGSSTTVGAFEVGLLGILASNEAGKIATFKVLATEQLDDAFAELDRLFAAGEAAGCDDAWRVVEAVVAATNRRDYSSMAELAVADFEVIDHRATGLGAADSAAFFDYLVTMATMVPDSQARIIAVPRIAPDGIAAAMLVAGESSEGASVEIDYLSVTSLRDGRAARTETFAFDQLDTALALFDDLHPPR
jgi:class 3 adenylate cyclase